MGLRPIIILNNVVMVAIFWFWLTTVNLSNNEMRSVDVVDNGIIVDMEEINAPNGAFNDIIENHCWSRCIMRVTEWRCGVSKYHRRYRAEGDVIERQAPWQRCQALDHGHRHGMVVPMDSDRPARMERGGGRRAAGRWGVAGLGHAVVVMRGCGCRVVTLAVSCGQVRRGHGS